MENDGFWLLNWCMNVEKEMSFTLIKKRFDHLGHVGNWLECELLHLLMDVLVFILMLVFCL